MSRHRARTFESCFPSFVFIYADYNITTSSSCVQGKRSNKKADLWTLVFCLLDKASHVII